MAPDADDRGHGMSKKEVARVVSELATLKQRFLVTEKEYKTWSDDDWDKQLICNRCNTAGRNVYKLLSKTGWLGGELPEPLRAVPEHEQTPYYILWWLVFLGWCEKRATTTGVPYADITRYLFIGFGLSGDPIPYDNPTRMDRAIDGVSANPGRSEILKQAASALDYICEDVFGKPIPTEGPTAGPNGTRKVPKDIEMMGRAVQLEECFNEEIAIDTGRKPTCIVREAGVSYETFLQSRHFKAARDAKETLMEKRALSEAVQRERASERYSDYSN